MNIKLPKLLFCSGVGGVGKTTLSAALALKWAHEGNETALLTIDPAQRLADSLGIKLSNTETSIQDFPLDAMMLDPKSCFDQFIIEHLKDSNELLNNRYYKMAAQDLGGIQEMMAIIRIDQLISTQKYDVIIIDTPPAQNAIAFLEAPQKLQYLLEASLFRFLRTQENKDASFKSQLISKGIIQSLKLFLGPDMIDELQEFFGAFFPVSEKLVERAKKIDQILLNEKTRFLLISTPLRHPEELKDYFNHLNIKGYPIAGLLLNRSPHQISKENIQDIKSYVKFLEYNEILHTRKAELINSIDKLSYWEILEQMTPPQEIEGLMEIRNQLPQIQDVFHTEHCS